MMRRWLPASFDHQNNVNHNLLKNYGRLKRAALSSEIERNHNEEALKAPYIFAFDK
jgi:hypothetical protein